MKYIKFKIFAFLLALLAPGVTFAVTDQEMEQARTIAAKAYLRYANDGSGYLDDLNPKTMQELEASLKTKEKENIKAFKAISVPSDYKDWNKDKLVEFWSVTAFQNKGLLEKGRGGRIRARSQINKMTISTSPQAPISQEPSEVSKSETSANETNPTPDNITTSELNAVYTEEELRMDEEKAEEDLDVDQAGNYTWVYIMVLAILVAIVIALVVYAMKVMKKNNFNTENYQPADSDLNALTQSQQEEYESVLADKNVEIAMLKKKLESFSRQNSEMKVKIDNLTAELETLQSQKVSETRNTASSIQGESNGKEEVKDLIVTTLPKKRLHTIYLGRANSRGIFIRADRTINPGHSIFELETSDGFTGTFRVIDSPSVWSLALSNPQEYLEKSCMGPDLDSPGNATKIITESSGTAVFEGGCWRVIRKTRIRYE